MNELQGEAGKPSNCLGGWLFFEGYVSHDADIAINADFLQFIQREVAPPINVVTKDGRIAKKRPVFWVVLGGPPVPPPKEVVKPGDDKRVVLPFLSTNFSEAFYQRLIQEPHSSPFWPVACFNAPSISSVAAHNVKVLKLCAPDVLPMYP